MNENFGPKSTAEEVLSGIDLQGKRFLITGASSGIGLETVRALVSHGASVVAAVRHPATAAPATAAVCKAASRADATLQWIELDPAPLRSIRAGAGKLLAVALIDHTPNPFADGVRSYALDPTRAEQLWTRSEELVSAANALEPLS